MKYVIDSSVAFKWVVPESDSDKAELLRDSLSNAIDECLAPNVFTAEVAHGLTKAERQGRILIGQAALLWADVMLTSPVLFSSDSLIPRAIVIASSARIGVYDCIYVALAEREGCELITADDRLIRNLQPRFPFIVSLAAFP